MRKFLVSLILAISVLFKPTSGILQARSSETREVVSLDGLWYFTTNSSFAGNVKEANDLEVNLMPVPSSYNDIGTTLSLRDHVGAVWYQRKFFAPSAWSDKKVWIRFGSVCYNASVSINNEVVLTHNFGHLPFLAEITSVLNYGKENTITVEVNNILTDTTLPQGTLKTLVSGRIKQKYNHDFFNYAGIDRPVFLYTTSTTAHIDDITIQTHLNGTSGLVMYDVAIVGRDDSIKQQVNILDEKGDVVASSSAQNPSGTLTVENANFWWPYLMDPNPGYLYTLEVLVTQDNVLIDHYKEPFGIRELHYDNNSFTINGKDIYIRGFGRHEDSDIRGKGLDLPLIIRDHHLIKWVGANCYRTSHYPYAEEIMDLADQLGIMIIDEGPAVGLENFTGILLENHKQSITELYGRDKNRPSVIIWSVSNEPNTALAESEDYFREIRDHIKTLDVSRPITIANYISPDNDHSGQFLDILGFNYYEGWYGDIGELEDIYSVILKKAKSWRKHHNKPVIMTEYGADSIGGLSTLPSFAWSEDYQLELMEQFYRAFDELRSEGWFVGEMIWNFADFRTDQNVKRVVGNRKGLFSRNRQPKRAAFFMRKRYWALANELDNATLPNDLDQYVIDSRSFQIGRNEL